MRIFKTKAFARWAKEMKLSDSALQQAMTEIESGLYEANLGSDLYKKRVPLGNRGKSHGARTIIAFKQSDQAFFIYGFSKNQKANVKQQELTALKKSHNCISVIQKSR